MARKPFKHGRSVCIFCGKTPTTEEHVWAQWAHSILPSSSHYQNFILSGRMKSGILSRMQNYTRQGSVKTMTIKCLCSSCNNLWLGRQYEEKLKSELTALYLGSKIVLTQELIDQLTEYLTAKIMILDWFHKDPVLSLSHGREFFERRLPPPGFCLFIFNCPEGEWRSAFRAFSCAMSTLDGFNSATAPNNTKSIAIGLGNLFVFSVISTSIKPDLPFDQIECVRLWPHGERARLWPPLRAISSDDAEDIASILHRFARSKFVIDVS